MSDLHSRMEYGTGNGARIKDEPMLRLSVPQPVLCPLLCVALLTGQISTLSAQMVSQGSARNRTPVRVQDVRLQSDGTIVGTVVDPQGRAAKGELVAVSAGRRHFGQVSTDRRGRFRIPLRRGGLYQLSTSQGQSVVRVWPPTTAPRKATSRVLVVNGSRVVRGQLPSGVDITSAVFFAGTLIGGGFLIHHAVKKEKTGN